MCVYNAMSKKVEFSVFSGSWCQSQTSPHIPMACDDPPPPYAESTLLLPPRTQPSPFKQYFYPLTNRAYYSSFFHLAILNFPYALASWVSLFVLTVVSSLPLHKSHAIMLLIDRDYSLDGTPTWRRTLFLWSSRRSNIRKRRANDPMSIPLSTFPFIPSPS